MDLNPRRETFGQADYGWLGSSHGTESCASITIDESTLTEGTHYPDGYLPSGTPLGLISDTGLYGLWSDSDVDGEIGFLLEPVKVTSGSNPIGALLEHGVIIADQLPFEIDSSVLTAIAVRFVVRNAEEVGS